MPIHGKKCGREERGNALLQSKVFFFLHSSPKAYNHKENEL